MADVKLTDVWKIYDDGTKAVEALDLEIRDGELMIFVGPSGCGKTTALRMIAGLEEITKGEIAIGNRIVNQLHAQDRDVAMVFQNYALYPHMSVFDNIAFGLKMRKVPRKVIRQRVHAIAGVLGLEEYLKKKPKVLSGGQRQRVAMGRAIVREPQVFLMDEPLSNLDAKLRVQMRAEVSRIQRELGTTMIYVTHDQIEAMTMGMRVTVLRRGRLQQVAAPHDVYRDPANLFVATFMGSPPMNLLVARLEREGASLVCRIGEGSIVLDSQMLADRPALMAYAGRPVAVGIRPESIIEPALLNGHATRIRGTAVATETLGLEQLIHLDVNYLSVKAATVTEATEDGEIEEGLHASGPVNGARFICRLSTDTVIALGDVVEVGVTSSQLHFFDLDTHEAIRS